MPVSSRLPVASHDDAVALFRYGLIADLLHLAPGHRRLQAQLREKAEREYEIPGSARRRVAAAAAGAAGGRARTRDRPSVAQSPGPEGGAGAPTSRRPRTADALRST